VLTDFASYSEWNPVGIKMEGKPIVGTVLHHTSKIPGRKPMRFSPTIVEAEPNRVLAWKGRVFVPGLFDVLHRFELSETGGAGRILRQSERFSGVLVPLVAKTLRQTRQALDVANEAIKSRSEGIANSRA
jgi:hypothetical protein